MATCVFRIIGRNVLSYGERKYTCRYFQPSRTASSKVVHRLTETDFRWFFLYRNQWTDTRLSSRSDQVDQIKTVEPTDTKDLRIEKGQDFVTLLTCTPYMVNSHRLLVRGHRVPYHAKEVQKEVQKVSENKRFFLYGLLAACILIFLLLIYLFRQSFKIRNRS